MRTALVVITDGRIDYLRQTWASFTANCSWVFDTIVLVDDSGDPVLQKAATELVNPDVAVRHGRRMGGAAAIRAAWRNVRTLGVDYVFHLEDDWRFLQPVPVAEMIGVLEGDPDLANVVLRRQPWGTEPPGGYIAANPRAFTDRDGYLEHRQGFWLNPGVYRADVIGHGWPINGHESDFTARLAPLGYRFAVYGKRSDPPRCWHIGNDRSQSWTW